ncbi:hypothetical protein THARTR1_02898 [Trichoderma harzianum]|uniref:Uncharacterized protein n=1 Tax=Trichoderma harzianum TaxID=5544 RepID=A0A2K0UH24_TRIHA|nr:hypothetical protein THARTR1_02898 [Trichoderma harzianum]
MDDDASHLPYDVPEEEMHNFFSIISFLSEHFNQRLFCFPSSQEVELSRRFQFSTTFGLLESVINVHFSDGSNFATKGIGKEWYRLAQLIESWLLSDRVNEMIENLGHGAETADGHQHQNTHPHIEKMEETGIQAMRHLHIEKSKDSITKGPTPPNDDKELDPVNTNALKDGS